MSSQPTPGLAAANCPANSNASTCPIFRGELAVAPGRNEMYAWVVDVQPDIEPDLQTDVTPDVPPFNNGGPVPADEGIWKSTTGGANWIQIPDNGITNCGDNAFGPNNSGCGVEQGYYNLELAAIPNAAGTDLYAGAVNLYKCTLEGGTVCTQGDWINLTHVYGCNPGPLGAPAHVHPNQHDMAFVVAGGEAPGYFAHDGGISRTLDGYSGLDTGSCAGTNQFDSLSQTLGSMTEFVSVSVHPTNADIMLGGAQGNGSPKTASATGSATWQNALGGDGAFTAINPINPEEWFAANPFVSILKCEFGTDCDDSGFAEVVTSANLGGDQGAFYTPFILDPQNSDAMLVGTCRVWRVGTSGEAALQLSNDFETLGTGTCTGDEINLVTALAAGGPVDANGNSTVVYAVTNGDGPLSDTPGGEVWATTSAGVTLMANVTQNVNPNGYAISSVAVDPSDATGETAYVGIMGFHTSAFPTSHVWKTTNAGVSWSDWDGGSLPDAPVDALLVDDAAGLIYAGTDVGVFVSSTNTAAWVEAGPQPAAGVAGFLPEAPVTALQMFNPNAGTKTLVASTYGRGVWAYDLVVSPDYSNTISNSPQTIFVGETATFDGTLTARNGYASAVNLSCSGAATATCILDPVQVTPTGSYTLTAGGTVGDYSFSAHAVGTDGNAITHDASVALHVVDFYLTAPNPNSISVGQGSTSAPSTFQVTAAGSFSGTVALSCPTGLPAGAVCVFSPSSAVSPTSSMPVNVTLTVTAGAATPVGGPTAVTVAATTAGAPSAKAQTFTLTVTGPAPDFAIAVTASPDTTPVSQNVTWNGTVTALNGYSGSVQLTCTAGAPPTCGISPSTLTPTSSGTAFAVTLGSGAAGNFNFAIQGSDGTLTHATPIETLMVTTPVAGFDWVDTGDLSVTVTPGQSATYTFSADPNGGTFNGAVNFGCSGLPALSSCSFSPASIPAGAGNTAVTLTVSTTGTSAGVAHRAPGVAGGGCPYVIVCGGMLMLRMRRRSFQRLRSGMALFLLALGVMAMTSCGGLATGGGGGGGGSTPPGTSLITVTASEAGGASHGDVVTLIVQ